VFSRFSAPLGHRLCLLVVSEASFLSRSSQARSDPLSTYVVLWKLEIRFSTTDMKGACCR